MTPVGSFVTVCRREAGFFYQNAMRNAVVIFLFLLLVNCIIFYQRKWLCFPCPVYLTTVFLLYSDFHLWNIDLHFYYYLTAMLSDTNKQALTTQDCQSLQCKKLKPHIQLFNIFTVHLIISFNSIGFGGQFIFTTTITKTTPYPIANLAHLSYAYLKGKKWSSWIILVNEKKALLWQPSKWTSQKSSLLAIFKTCGKKVPKYCIHLTFIRKSVMLWTRLALIEGLKFEKKFAVDTKEQMAPISLVLIL